MAVQAILIPAAPLLAALLTHPRATVTLQKVQSLHQAVSQVLQTPAHPAALQMRNHRVVMNQYQESEERDRRNASRPEGHISRIATYYYSHKAVM